MVITEDFLPALAAWGVAAWRISVIENWAPLDQVTPMAKDNPWSREHRLADVPVLLYAGTLGLKHDPLIILGLAEHLPDARVVVVSEGIGAEWLREHGASADNLVVLPFQLFDRLSEVLAAADVLLTILEPDAGAYSVPSKVLDLPRCRGGPSLERSRRRTWRPRPSSASVRASWFPPGDVSAFVEAGRVLLADPPASGHGSGRQVVC